MYSIVRLPETVAVPDVVGGADVARPVTRGLMA